MLKNIQGTQGQHPYSSSKSTAYLCVKITSYQYRKWNAGFYTSFVPSVAKESLTQLIN